jgi:uncharacterized protein YeaO (DUF488 family)
MIKVVRVYDVTPDTPGARYLVDRLWPRGVSKADLPLDGWAKDAAPSHDLRHEFHGDPSRWADFRDRYEAELDANPEAWQPLLQAARRGDVLLLYGSKDTEHNNAVVLRDYLAGKLKHG